MSLCCCRRFLLLCVWLGVLIESFCLIDEREKCVRAQQIVFDFHQFPWAYRFEGANATETLGHSHLRPGFPLAAERRCECVACLYLSSSRSTQVRPCADAPSGTAILDRVIIDISSRDPVVIERIFWSCVEAKHKSTLRRNGEARILKNMIISIFLFVSVKYVKIFEMSWRSGSSRGKQCWSLGFRQGHAQTWLHRAPTWKPASAECPSSIHLSASFVYFSGQFSAVS